MTAMLKGTSDAGPQGRVVSIDIFRGLTVAVMIFVNSLAEVRGLPWWTYHAHAQDDVMTYVDMVFPFFLFSVGMSLPLSIEHRLKRNPSHVALCGHLLMRVAGLLVLGLILANADICNATRTGMPGSLWALLGLVAAGLYLNVYPKSWRIAPVLRGVGLAGVVALLAVFRRTTPGGHGGWLEFGYPEILGLIGLSYLVLVILYVPTRRWRWAPAVWVVVLAAFCALCAAQRITFPEDLSLYEWPLANGALVCVMMAGVLTTVLFQGEGARGNPRRTIRTAVAVAAVLLAAGKVLAPLGISKIRATPTWALWSAGAAMLMFALLWWICDVKRRTGWAWPVRAAGNNTLTAYLLPDLWEFGTTAAGATLMATHWTVGWLGVVKVLAFTAAMLGLTQAVTRRGVRLQF